MKRTLLAIAASLFALGLLVPGAARAQSQAPVVSDLLYDVNTVEEKLLGLAEAMPAESYAWRPGEGVRSTAEVFIHVAADNWLLPAFAGRAAPAETGIRPDSYETVRAYEGRTMSRDEILAALRASFDHVKTAMAGTSAARLDEQVDVFGNPMTVRRLWVMTTTHLHEHLGQMIAYARSNDVVPPWSR